jgi:hypothetical protein
VLGTQEQMEMIASVGILIYADARAARLLAHGLTQACFRRRPPEGPSTSSTRRAEHDVEGAPGGERASKLALSASHVTTVFDARVEGNLGEQRELSGHWT